MDDSRRALRLTYTTDIADVDVRAWNSLAGDSPFLRHEFLAALEKTRCVGADTAWQPHHLLISDDERGLAGAMPLYIKHDSRGEFVFDWGWANAYEQAGLAYYPKLVSAVPFTPVTGHRLLIRDGTDHERVAELLLEGARRLCSEIQASSLHILFPTDAEQKYLSGNGLHRRKGCQFHWHNESYPGFEAFLATFTSAKRKKARRERRRIAEAGIRFEHLRADELSERDWDAVFDFYSRTFLRRGRLPYLNRGFFAEITRTMPESVVVILARYGPDPIATAICFRSRATLYGRYWGSLADFHSLHFEACYYQGIDYCIREGLARFEPGTQGEHKVSRGFVPTATWSSHWLSDSEFDRALGELLAREQLHVDAYMHELAA
ncbi:MAG TPA: GNAT family N-acetyltransferase, partial [Gammaproteobacteria bacterium]|nr:GNAT family N-acetyltransferase [Gammaproteobacteria bacterium]